MRTITGRRSLAALLAAGALCIAGLLGAGASPALAAGTITIEPIGTLSSYDGDPVYVQLHASDSTPGVTLTYSINVLPTGLTLNAATGVISGRLVLGPDLGGLGYNLTVTVTGSDGATATSTFGWNRTNQFIDVPLGPVRSAYPGVCLDDRGNSTKAGSPLQLWTCDGASGEWVTWRNGSTVQVLGKCAEDPGGSSKAGTPVRLYPCDGASSQVIRQLGDQLMFFPSEIAAGCVDAPRGTAGTGLVLATSGCPAAHGHPEPTGTRWNLPTTSIGVGLDGKCLAGTTTAVTEPCDDRFNQDWSLHPTDFTLGGLSEYEVVDQTGTICLSAHGGGTANGTKVDWETCAFGLATPASPSQLWIPENGTLVNAKSRSCLDVPGARTTSGLQLDISRCTGGTSQQWTTPAAPVAAEIPGDCLAAHAISGSNGTAIVTASCASATAPVPTQDWTFTGTTVRDQGKCLTLRGGHTTTGNSVVLSTCESRSTIQQWRVASGGLLRNPLSGKCLAFPGTTPTAGAGLVIKPCSSAPAAGEEWHGI
jgi:hypothetical protein